MIKQTTRNKVLASLLSNVNNCVSGQELADGLSISRTAINAHISKLITNGFDIEKIHGHGYRLTHIPDSITQPVMQHFMQENKDDFQFIYHKSVTSTNLLAKNLADQGQVSGTVIVADEQTKGRGRLGRTWHSWSKVGLWMSVILRPALLARDAGKITLLTALAVNSSIRTTFQL